MKVEILSRKLITPSSPTPPNHQTLKLSSFDQLLITPVYVVCMYYYPACSGTDEEGGVVNNSVRSKKLQKSLSELLTIYHPLAGRYNEGTASIDCNDEGAEYLEAKVSGTLSQFLEGEELETESRNQLLPYIIQPPNAPLVGVQFNLFECGGVAIGVSVTHRLADGSTTLRFIDDWATASRVGIDKVSSPSFELGSICPPRDLPPLSIVDLPQNKDKKFVSKSFVFEASSISKLKAIAAGNSNTDDQSGFPKLQPTRFEVMVALIIRALARVSQARHGFSRPFILGFTFNMRGRTTILPENCCGNLAVMATSQEVVMSDADTAHIKKQLRELVDHVHNTLATNFADCAKASNAENLFLMTFDSLKKLIEIQKRCDVDIFGFNSWCRFPMYETDFGWGKPCRITPMYAPMELSLLQDTKDGKGIEAWIFLEENSMVLFQKDPEIMEFSAK